MSVKQYTIRNIPPRVDHYLRKRARLSGKSLNEVVVLELSASAGINKKGLAKSLDWFVGSEVMDGATLKALDEARNEQNKLVAKEFELGN